jgi:parallel beta-helix repeat protein
MILQKRWIFLFALVFVSLLCLSFVEAIDVTNCTTLDTQNGVYTLQNNITSSGTCITLTANNISLNLNGFGLNGSDSSAGIHINGYNNSKIYNGFVMDCSSGLYLQNSFYNSVVNVTFSSNVGNGGIAFFGASDSNITNSTFIDNNNGIFLFSESHNNLIENNNFSSGNSYGVYISEFGGDPVNETTLKNNDFYFVDVPIKDLSGSSFISYLIYDNLFGEIRWIESTFLKNLDLTKNLTFPGTIAIANNSVYLNSTHFAGEGINSSANITFYNFGERGYSSPVILKDGVECTDCYNFTALNVSTVIFNVTSWSNYSIGEDTTLTDCATLGAENTVYTLQNNINSSVTCITVGANGVTLNLAGYNLTGELNQNGVTINGYNDSKIYNGSIMNFSVGISVGSKSKNITLEEIKILDSYSGIFFGGQSQNNTIVNLTLSNLSSAGIVLQATTNNLFNNISISSAINAITLDESYEGGPYIAPNNCTFLNIITHSITGSTIDDDGTGFNFFIYNNTLGEIKWIDSSFLGNLTVYGNLTFPGTIAIANNSVYLNSTHFAGEGINSSANITFYNFGERGYSSPVILKDGVECTDCYNFTALNASTVIFNVTSWSNYSIGGGVVVDSISPLITLDSPLNQTYNDSMLDFNITSNENLSSCVVSLDNFATNYTLSLNSSLTGGNYSLTGIEDGNYLGVFWCNDTNGNINNTVQVNFTINDTTAPKVTISSPTTQTYTVDNYAASLVLSETGYCEYSLNSGGNNVSLSSADNLTFTGSVSGVANAAYVLNAYCNDSAGNRNDSVSVSFTVSVSAGGDSGGGNPGGGTCTPDCSGVDAVCIGESFSDGCSGTCAGTKICPPPTCTPICPPDYIGSDGCEGFCYGVCTPYCPEDYEGSDGCGGTCADSGGEDECIGDECEDNGEDDGNVPTWADSGGGIFSSKEINLTNKNCTVNWTCEDWGDCSYEYNAQKLIYGLPLDGEQRRICRDLNKCASNKLERKFCSAKQEILVEKINWCNQEYMELKNHEGRVISRLKRGKNGGYLDVDFALMGQGYCEYCFDDVQNFDEKGIDCGGSCISCELKNQSLLMSKKNIWIPSVFLIFFFGLFISSSFYLGKPLINSLKGAKIDLNKKYKKWKKQGYDVFILDHLKK